MVFDCGHGAAANVLPFIFESLHESRPVIGAEPNGLNINERAGVMHLAHLEQYIKENQCTFGAAYDGDADRTLLMDGRGRIIDGDVILWVLARWLKVNDGLGSGVVATVMSNLALDDKLAGGGISLFRCAVGDRYVLEMMQQKGVNLGGEQSGHIISLPCTNTGDGICTTLLFLRACKDLSEEIDTLVDRFERYPQRLRNVELPKGTKVDAAHVKEVSDNENANLKGTGRVLIRPSGTEPLLRILVEARDLQLVEDLSEHLANLFKQRYSNLK
jgi:phosphoglucosamine mutase